ncbi:hypothetical protein HK096_001379, partial [Nowakowskiella sp. JEL0078]
KFIHHFLRLPSLKHRCVALFAQNFIKTRYLLNSVEAVSIVSAVCVGEHTFPVPVTLLTDVPAVQLWSQILLD